MKYYYMIFSWLYTTQQAYYKNWLSIPYNIIMQKISTLLL